MASCITAQWSNSYTPQAKLTVTQSSSTETTATLSWTLQYVAHGYAVNTSTKKSYSVVIGGETVKSGTYDIDGKTGTTTIASGTKTITKGTSSKSVSFKVSFAFNLTWSDVYGGTKTASGSISVAAKTSYSVAYSANGGNGAPSSQTKWHGETLTLSSTKPTRTGHTFQNWLSSAQGTTYAPGAFYGHDASTTMTAQWKANTFTVTYDANGGTGAPSSQTKTYGTALTLSSTKPTRANYNFLGWATSASATTATYAAGGSYTTNADVTLYAVWELAYTKPRITGLTVSRCDSSGNATDSGTYALVKFSWATDRAVSSIVCSWVSASGNSGSATISASGTNGIVNQLVGGNISADETYTLTVKVTDSGGNTDASSTLNGAVFAIDCLVGNRGVAFGKPAEKPGIVDSAWDIYAKGKIVRAKRCIVGQNTSSDTNPWYKFASAKASAINEDMRISFKITYSYGSNTRFGILNAMVRTQNASGANAFQRLEFECDTGLDSSNFVMVYSNTGADGVYELWVKLTAYRFCMFEVLSESSRTAYTDNWTLYDQISAGYAAEPTSGYTKVSATKPYLLNAYPVGSYYISANDTSPASLFGGTWHRIESRFLWAAPADSTLGATAGEMTHTLTINEMPEHRHTLARPKWYAADGGSNGSEKIGTNSIYGTTGSTVDAYKTSLSHSGGILATGGGAAHNNMPPYVNVAIWRREA